MKVGDLLYIMSPKIEVKDIQIKYTKFYRELITLKYLSKDWKLDLHEEKTDMYRFIDAGDEFVVDIDISKETVELSSIKEQYYSNEC